MLPRKEEKVAEIQLGNIAKALFLTCSQNIVLEGSCRNSPRDSHKVISVLQQVDDQRCIKREGAMQCMVTMDRITLVASVPNPSRGYTFFWKWGATNTLALHKGASPPAICVCICVCICICRKEGATRMEIRRCGGGWGACMLVCVQ